MPMTKGEWCIWDGKDFRWESEWIESSRVFDVDDDDVVSVHEVMASDYGKRKKLYFQFSTLIVEYTTILQQNLCLSTLYH